MKFSPEFCELPRDRLLFPNREYNGLNYLYWYGDNLGRIALSVASSNDPKILTLFKPPPVTLYRDEQAAAVEAFNARGALDLRSDSQQNMEAMLEELAYTGNGEFPGIVIGVTPTMPPQGLTNGHINVASVFFYEADPYAQDVFGHIFHD